MSSSSGRFKLALLPPISQSNPLNTTIWCTADFVDGAFHSILLVAPELLAVFANFAVVYLVPIVYRRNISRHHREAAKPLLGWSGPEHETCCWLDRILITREHERQLTQSPSPQGTLLTKLQSARRTLYLYHRLTEMGMSMMRCFPLPCSR